MGIDEKELELKRKVAIGTRILAHQGLLDYLGSVSGRLPGSDRIWVVSAFGLENPSRADTTLRQVVCIDLDGRVLEGDQDPTYEWRQHVEVYRARPDVGSVVHTHQKMAKAFAIAEREILPLLHIQSKIVARPIPVFSSAAFVSTSERARLLAKTLGDHYVCHLRNHGVIVVGKDVEEATVNTISLEQLAEMNFITAVLGKAHVVPAEEIEKLAAATGDLATWLYYSHMVRTDDLEK
jgi:ribulose-5-phosphate 4-epimerase/fuculose-1-phosphate aldolase